MGAWRIARCCCPPPPPPPSHTGWRWRTPRAAVAAAVTAPKKLSRSLTVARAATAAGPGDGAPPDDEKRQRRRAYDALLLDAGGTLLQLARPVADTYADIGRKYGMNATVSEIKQGFKRAFAAPWPEKLRYQGDGRPFWKFVVSEATGCSSDDYFTEVYEHFANGDAWNLPIGAHKTLCSLRNAGVKLAVVSNFDTRLRKLLKDLNVADLFDAIIISSEVGYEKPDAKIFKAALDQVGVEAGNAVHVGDDEKADKMGANAVDIDCWLWGSDVKTFAEIHERILVAVPQMERN